MAIRGTSKSSGSYKSTAYVNNNSVSDVAIKAYVYNDIINDKNANKQPSNNYNSSANNLTWYWILLIIVGGLFMLGGILTAYSYK
jgi:beta-lactamase regulating signal transducer with metallopeptidase domain